MHQNAEFIDHGIYRGIDYELILASVSLDQSNYDHIYDILKKPLDWSLITNIVRQLGVLPLFCNRLLSSAEKDLPHKDIDHLKYQLQVSTQSILRVTWKLIQCVELLASNGIKSIILKGPVLALQAYGDLNLRQFTDLDILIHQEDFPAAYDLLLDNGYVPSINLNSSQKKFIVWSDNHFSFDRQGDIIEVHWKIVPQENIPPLHPDRLWQQTQHLQVGNQVLQSLSLENTFLYLCFHGAKHGWSQLKWIVDLAYLSQTCSESFWFPLLKLSKKFGIFRQVSLGLLLAEELIHAELPLGVHDQINKDSHTKQLAAQVITRLFTGVSTPIPIDQYMFYMKTREHWLDRLRYLIGLIFLPERSDWLLFSLPESMYFLYYIFRPLRLIYNAGKSAITS